MRYIRFYSLTLFILTLVPILFTGCTIIHGSHKLFEDTLNYYVGSPIELWLVGPYKKHELDDGTTEYTFTEENGCSYTIVVDEGIVISWRYESDPSLCTRQSNLGPW